MAEKKRPGGQESDKAAEARNLAQYALEEMKHSDREEGKFLAEEAAQLDQPAAGKVLKKSGSKSAETVVAFRVCTVTRKRL
jgi:hypothetical protein